MVDIETDVWVWAIRYDLMFCCSDIALDIDFWTLVDASCVPMISDCVGCDVLSVIFFYIYFYVVFVLV